MLVYNETGLIDFQASKQATREERIQAQIADATAQLDTLRSAWVELWRDPQLQELRAYMNLAREEYTQTLEAARVRFEEWEEPYLAYSAAIGEAQLWEQYLRLQDAIKRLREDLADDIPF